MPLNSVLFGFSGILTAYLPLGIFIEKELIAFINSFCNCAFAIISWFDKILTLSGLKIILSKALLIIGLL